jgi:thiol-disulfide isomerase/thioredoxin
MSSKKYENYSRFSDYNSNSSGKSGAYKTYETISGQKPLPPSISQGDQSPQTLGIRKNQQNQYKEGQPTNGLEQTTRVKEIDGVKLFNLLTNSQFHVTKSGSRAKIIIKVYTSWCGPCKNIAPRFEEISRDPKYNDILFVQVDGEKLGDNLGKFLNVGAVPVFFGFVSGQNKGMVSGTNIAEILNLCDTVANDLN